MTKRLLAVFAFACAASAAQAEVYRWVDAQGVTHYTGDINQVPASQRDLARRSVPSGKGSLQRMTAPARAAAAAPSDARAPEVLSAGAPPASAGEERVEGKTEAQWRDEAATARGRLERAEASAEHCRHDSLRLSASSRREKYEEERAEAERCDRTRAEAEAARQALEQLEERAHRAGVPPGWVRE